MLCLWPCRTIARQYIPSHPRFTGQSVDGTSAYDDALRIYALSAPIGNSRKWMEPSQDQLCRLSPQSLAPARCVGKSWLPSLWPAKGGRWACGEENCASSSSRRQKSGVLCTLCVKLSCFWRCYFGWWQEWWLGFPRWRMARFHQRQPSGRDHRFRCGYTIAAHQSSFLSVGECRHLHSIRDRYSGVGQRSGIPSTRPSSI